MHNIRRVQQREDPLNVVMKLLAAPAILPVYIREVLEPKGAHEKYRKRNQGTRVKSSGTLLASSSSLKFYRILCSKLLFMYNLLYKTWFHVGVKLVTSPL